jgi:hypothetical protein
VAAVPLVEYFGKYQLKSVPPSRRPVLERRLHASRDPNYTLPTLSEI